MKLIETVIKPVHLDEVRTTLQQLGVEEIMVSQTVSQDDKTRESMFCTGTEYVADVITKVKVEIVVADDLVNEVAETIMKIAATGQKRDCRICILPIDETRIYFAKG